MILAVLTLLLGTLRWSMETELCRVLTQESLGYEKRSLESGGGR